MKWLKKKDNKESGDEVANQLNLADRLSRRVLHASNALDIVNGTINDLRQYLDIDWAALSIHDESLEQLVVHVIKDGDIVKESTTLQGTPIFWVVVNKQALIQKSTRDDLHFESTFFAIPDLKTLVHMPLFYQGEVYGVLSVGSYQLSNYKDEQLRLLKHSTALLAISVKGALLMEKNLETEALLVDLNDLMRILTHNPELTDVLPVFVERLSKIVRVDRLLLATPEGRRLRIVVDHNGEGKYPQQQDLVNLSSTSVSWLMVNDGIHIEEDIEQQKRFDIDEFFLKDGYRGVIRLPILVQQRFIGVVILLSVLPYQIEKEMEFLNQLKNYMVAPVESYLLYLIEKQRIEWLSALSHHLRTPLTPVVASAQMLVGKTEQAEDKMMAKLANNIDAGAKNLKKYLELFWDLSEVESPEFSINIDSFDLAGLIDQVVQDRTSAADVKDQKLTPDLPKPGLDVKADEQIIKKMLTYLVNEAIALSPNKSHIGLKVVDSNEDIVIEVFNPGVNLSADEIERILTAYTYSESDMKTHPSLTLITAICTRLAQYHGGRFWIEDNPAGGSKYLISIPLIK
jgi:K+-sensing histidine kinase KdpD